MGAQTNPAFEHLRGLSFGELQFLFHAMPFSSLPLPLFALAIFLGGGTAGAFPFSTVEALASGAMQGITEFLPISSSAHLLLLERVLTGENLSRSGRGVVLTNYHLLLQLASIFPVFWIYRRRIGQILSAVILRSSRAHLRPLGLLLVAFFPSAAMGLFVDRHFCAAAVATPLMGSFLFAGGVGILLFERLRGNRGRGNIENLSWRSAWTIGLLQTFALFPGVSRSLLSIVGGLWMGLSPASAVEFSFLLGSGTICAAVAHRLLTRQMASILPLPVFPLTVGIFTAFFCSALSISFLLHWLQRHSLRIFGVYRIGLGIFLLFL